MVYNTQNYCFFGLCSSSSIPKSRKDIPETGCFHRQVKGETSTLSKGQKQDRCLPLNLRTEIDPVSETLCFLVFRILDDGQTLKSQ
jgi:hypothetical protein